MAGKRKSLGLNILLLGILVVALASFALTLSLIQSQNLDTEAAKGGNPGGSTASITLDQVDPHLGDSVTFTTSGGSGINVVCYQGGGLKMVYAAYQSVGTAFLLGGTSSDWKTNGGEVDCSAYLYGSNPRKGVLATTYFHAGGAR